MSKRHRLQNYILRRFEVTIDSISARGWGQGTFLGEGERRIPAEVRGALPGDVVLAEGRGIDKGMIQAILVEILQSGYPRQASSCPHSCVRCDKDTGCGGCTLRECDYETQCRIKRDILVSMLKQNGLDMPVDPILPCANQAYYRNKMELSFGPDGADALGVGLHPSGFRFEVISMKHCDMLSPLLVELAQKTEAWARELGLAYYRFRENAGFLRTLTLRHGKRTDAYMVILTTSGESEVRMGDGSVRDANDVVREYADRVLATLNPPIDSFYWTTVTPQKGRQTSIDDTLIFGSPVLRETMFMPDEAHALHYEVLPHAFFQPNTLQAEKLYQVVLDMAAPHMTPNTPVLDLYCGTGTIALSFARHGHRAVAIAIEKQAIENARENARKNGLEDAISFYAGDTAEILRELLDGQANFDGFLLVVDPPRRGLLPPAYRQILRIRPDTLIYVSCNPESLAQDLARFKVDGYDICRIQPVDMLPQTAHLETVVLLSKRKC